MATNNCPTCGGCCVTVCQDFVSPRCECCDALGSMTLAPNQEIKAGQAVAENADGQLVAFNPNALTGDLTQSAKFVGHSITFWTTNDAGILTNRGTNHPLAGNPCPKNRVLFWQCGIFRINLIPAFAGLNGLDIARAIVAMGRGHFLPLGENENGEYKLY